MYTHGSVHLIRYVRTASGWKRLVRGGVGRFVEMRESKVEESGFRGRGVSLAMVVDLDRIGSRRSLHGRRSEIYLSEEFCGENMAIVARIDSSIHT